MTAIHASDDARSDSRTPKRRVPAFTLIELLVVVAIIASLIAILLPSMGKARATAKIVVCGTQNKQLITASFAYANEFKGWFPYRGSTSTSALPHTTNGSDYDLNKSFFPSYLNVRLNDAKNARVDDEVLFCPGDIREIRYPGLSSPDYRYTHITYQYFVMPDRDFRWLHEKNGQPYQPDLTRVDQIPAGRWSIWGDLTLARSPAGESWLAHDAADSPLPPSGMNTAFADGSVAWTEFARLEAFFQWNTGSQQWYWPIPQD